MNPSLKLQRPNRLVRPDLTGASRSKMPHWKLVERVALMDEYEPALLAQDHKGNQRPSL